MGPSNNSTLRFMCVQVDRFFAFSFLVSPTVDAATQRSGGSWAGLGIFRPGQDSNSIGPGPAQAQHGQ